MESSSFKKDISEKNEKPETIKESKTKLEENNELIKIKEISQIEKNR